MTITHLSNEVEMSSEKSAENWYLVNIKLMDIIRQGRAIISHQWSECKTKELLFSLVLCCSKRWKEGTVFVHTLSVNIYKITHQLLHMPKRKQAAYRTNNFSNFFFLVLCKGLTSFKSNTDIPNTAKSKLFILQRKHSTEKHNKRTAGTNIYKVLCPALIVHRGFSAPFDKLSKGC